MGVLPAVIGSKTITTTPSEVLSDGYYYHHITLYFTSTIGATDSYEIVQYKYNPVAEVYVRQFADTVNFESCGSTSDASKQDRAWEMNPTPSSGVKLIITKTAGNNGTLDYEIIKAS